MVPLLGTTAQHAVEMAPRVWWVGDVLFDDPFQCHAYLIEAGGHSVLVDPGSTLTISTTLRKVEEVVSLDDIEYVILHHSDPDIADGLHVLDSRLDRGRVKVVTEWRSAMLLKHVAVRFPFLTVEDLDWHLDLDEDRTLQFLLTPYLHFPGAFVTYDTATATLFSSDLFGGFNRAQRLWAQSADDFEDLRQFHEHYMPSREILMAGLASIRTRFPRIERVLPQHGYAIPEHLVGAMFDQLAALECGMMLASRSDTHLARLLAVAAVMRRVEHLLGTSLPFAAMMQGAEAEIGTLLPLRRLWVETRSLGGDLLRFDREHPLGEPLDDWTPAGGEILAVELDSHDDDPRLAVVLETEGPWTPLPELGSFIGMIGSHVRKVVDDALRDRRLQAVQHDLREAALHDPLTGLLNRRALDEPLVFAEPAGVLMIDIDHFKDVNDRHGHQVGDEVLKAVADAVTASLRHDDTAYRYGGEEILALVELDHGGNPLDAAHAIAERVRTRVEALDPAAFGIDQPITVSVGAVVLTPDQPLSANVHQADEALYRAKSMGRNRVYVAG